MSNALGLVEVIGMATAINTADVMLKAASVIVVKIEKTRGSGWMTIFISGDVGAVKAAVDSGIAIAKADNKYISSKIIPRPAHELETAFLEKELETEKVKPKRVKLKEKKASEKAVKKPNAETKKASEKAVKKSNAETKKASEKNTKEPNAETKKASEKAVKKSNAETKKASEKNTKEPNTETKKL